MPKLGGARGGIAYSDCRRVGALAVDCRGTCLTRPKGRAFRLVVPHCNTAKQTSWKHLYCGAISPCAMSPMTVWFILTMKTGLSRMQIHVSPPISEPKFFIVPLPFEDSDHLNSNPRFRPVLRREVSQRHD